MPGAENIRVVRSVAIAGNEFRDRCKLACTATTRRATPCTSAAGGVAMTTARSVSKLAAAGNAQEPSTVIKKQVRR